MMAGDKGSRHVWLWGLAALMGVIVATAAFLWTRSGDTQVTSASSKAPSAASQQQADEIAATDSPPAISDFRPSVYSELIPAPLVPLKDTRPWDVEYPRYPFRNVPRHPIDIVAECRSDDTAKQELLGWVGQWQLAAFEGKRSDQAAIGALGGLLERSDLPALAMVEAGVSFDLAGDEPVAAIWFRHGVQQGEKELVQLSDGDLRSRRLAEVLITVQTLMWPAQNNRQIDEAVSLEKLNHILLATLPPDDDQFTWADIGVADALCLQRRDAEALAWTEGIGRRAAGESLGEVQRAAACWVRGMLLYRSERYTEAIALLEVVCRNQGFQHSRDAWPIHIAALARDGQVEKAEKTIDAWVDCCRPTTADVAACLRVIEQARVQPAATSRSAPMALDGRTSGSTGRGTTR